MATADMTLVTERDVEDNGISAWTIYNRLVFDGVIDRSKSGEEVVPTIIDLLNQMSSLIKMRDAAENS